jgi:glycosyltransferase involved in cell wall biosynthesis
MVIFVNKKLVSIITPMYNAQDVIEDNIKSVLDQTYSNWEQIIIDDGSTDQSQKIVKKYDSVDNIRYFKTETNKGVSNARNLGLEKASGKYIAFLDSDDIWKSQKLEKQLQFMDREKSFFSFTAYEIVDQNYNIIKNKINVPKQVSYHKLLKGNVIACSTVMIDRSEISNIRMPDQKHEDFITWLSILKKDNIASGLNEVLTSYRKMENSITSNKLNSAKWTWNIYRNIENLNLLKSIYFFINYLIHGIRKHY